MINITGKDISYNEYTLPAPFWVSFESDADAPADSLTLTFLSAQIPEISTIKVEGDFFFNGIVDLISHEKSPSGEKTTLYARSLAAMYIDSEAAPGKTNLRDLESIMYNFDLGGRIKGFIYDTYTPMDSITIPKGSSTWYFLKTFCEQTMGNYPRITDDGYINAKALPDTSCYTFDEKNLVSVVRKTDFSDVVLSVTIRNEQGNYSMLLLNKKIQLLYPRQRFTIPSHAWVNNPDLAGEKILNQSLRNYKTVTLTYAEILPLKTFDCVTFEDKLYRIVSVKHTLDSKGAKSKITLSEKKYV